MRIKRTLPDTPVTTYGAFRHSRPASLFAKPQTSIQIVRTSPRLVVLKRAYREAGKQWKGVPMSFEEWYAEVVKFQREEGHAVK